MTTLVEPYTETQVLKENRYKKVALIEDADGTRFVAKTYRGHAEIYSRLNARYAYRVLKFCFDNFSDVATVPQPLGVNLDTQTVHIEFLAQLPTSQLLSLRTLNKSDKFFSRCYDINSDQNVLRRIQDSQIFSKPMQAWVEADNPLSLGFRGDLWQNLCLFEGGLIIADIDSASMEPLGLSELVLHAEIHASLSLRNLMDKVRFTIPKPICFEVLSREQARQILEITLLLVSNRMRKLPAFLRRAKLEYIQRVLSSCID